MKQAAKWYFRAKASGLDDDWLAGEVAKLPEADRAAAAREAADPTAD